MSGEEIIIESIRKMRISDGDILVVEMPDVKIPQAEMEHVMGLYWTKFDEVVDKAGYDCQVLILQHGVGLSILTREELEAGVKTADQKLTGNWKRDDIDLVYVIQKIVFFAYASYRAVYLPNPDNPELCRLHFREMLKNGISELVRSGILLKSDVVFDETVWPPTESEPDQFCEVIFSLKPTVEYYKLRMDMLKDERTGVSILYGPGGKQWTQFDPTQADFRVGG